MKFLVVVEKTPDNYSAYVPDLPGCVATGGTREEATALVKEAILFHLEGMREDGISVPEPQTTTVVVEV